MLGTLLSYSKCVRYLEDFCSKCKVWKFTKNGDVINIYREVRSSIWEMARNICDFNCFELELQATRMVEISRKA